MVIIKKFNCFSKINLLAYYFWNVHYRLGTAALDLELAEQIELQKKKQTVDFICGYRNSIRTEKNKQSIF